MSQPDPLHLRDAQQLSEDIGDLPSRDDLLRAWLHGTLSFEDYAARMDALYPMSVAEAEAARAKPYRSLWDDIITRLEAEREAAKGGRT